jgi:hypothetical protein
LNKVNLSEELELLPLLGGGQLIMQYDDRKGVFHMFCSKRQNKMLDVLHHTTDDDVVLGKHRVFHCVKYDVLSIHWLVGSLGDVQPISFNIVNVDIYLIVIAIESVILCCDYSLFVFIKAVELVFIFVWLVSISENLLGSGSVICYNITEVAVLVGL